MKKPIKFIIKNIKRLGQGSRFSFTINFLKGFSISLLVLAVLLLIFTAFTPIQTFKIFRVNSGSMEPAIKVGSIVIDVKTDSTKLKEGDIISYSAIERGDLLVTHRISKKIINGNSISFKTKGDANNNEDASEIKPSQIQGKVIIAIPYLGYLSQWIRKPVGFILMVVLPAVILIISEILNIRSAILDDVRKKMKENQKNINKVLMFLLFIEVSLLYMKPSLAYFTSTASIGPSTITMGTWGKPLLKTQNNSSETVISITPTPTSEITPTVTPTPEDSISTTPTPSVESATEPTAGPTSAPAL